MVRRLLAGRALIALRRAPEMYREQVTTVGARDPLTAP
jgi:hypothetical protein